MEAKTNKQETKRELNNLLKEELKKEFAAKEKSLQEMEASESKTLNIDASIVLGV